MLFHKIKFYRRRQAGFLTPALSASAIVLIAALFFFLQGGSLRRADEKNTRTNTGTHIEQENQNQDAPNLPSASAPLAPSSPASLLPSGNETKKNLPVSGKHRLSLDIGGRIRTFDIYVPDSPPTGKALYPIVIVLHGGGGNAEEMRRSTHFDDSAAERHMITVYPDGTGPVRKDTLYATWNAGRCCGQAMEKNIDDRGFISALIDKMVREFSADPDRIYAAGFSNGSQMAFHIACKLSGKIAAVAGAASVGEMGCVPSAPVPVLYFHSTEDPCAAYAGGEQGGCFERFINKLVKFNIVSEKTTTAISAPEYMKQWTVWDKLSGAVPATSPSASPDYSCQSWGGDFVVFCSMKNIGHAWPGGNHGSACDTNARTCALYEEIVGRTNSSIPANKIILDFFEKHSRQR